MSILRLFLIFFIIKFQLHIEPLHKYKYLLTCYGEIEVHTNSTKQKVHYQYHLIGKHIPITLKA